MERPKLCIDSLVKKAHTIFAGGGSFGEALAGVNDIRKKTELFVGDIDSDKQILHTLAFSALGILAITCYEYLKSHGVSLPDITTIVPAACISGPKVVSHSLDNEGKWITETKTGKKAREAKKRWI